MQTKKKKTQIIVVIILVILLLGLLGYILYNNQVSATKKETIDTGKALDINGNEVQNLMKKAEKEYKNSSYEIKKLSKEEIGNLGIYNALHKKIQSDAAGFETKAQYTNITGSITQEEILKEIVERYGSNVECTLTDNYGKTFYEDDIVDTGIVYSVKYDADKKEYTYSNGTLISGEIGEKTEQLEKIISATKYKNRIEVVVKAVDVICSQETLVCHVYKIYSDGEKKEKIEDISYLNFSPTLSTIYDKADRYKFTFIKDKNNYVFSSMQLIHS